MNYKDYIGRDITSLVTLPVWIMEPYTMLQKVAEIMEHTELLDRAAVTEDPYERRAFPNPCSGIVCTDAASTGSAAQETPDTLSLTSPCCSSYELRSCGFC